MSPSSTATSSVFVELFTVTHKAIRVGIAGANASVTFTAATIAPSSLRTACLSQSRRAPLTWALSGDPAECSSEMRLIGHSAGERDLAQCIVCCQHEIFSQLDAFQNYIRVGCDTEPQAECAMETAGTDTREASQRSDEECTGEVRIDVGHNFLLVH